MKKLQFVHLLLGFSALFQSGITTSAVSLNISPNLQQFFSGESVSLSCFEDGQESGWTIKRSRRGPEEGCGRTSSDFGVFRESTCVLDLLSSYTGVYWCETSSALRSEQINITVTSREDSALVLEIPALPVRTGSDISLHCRHTDGSIHAAYFYKNNNIVGDTIKSQNFIIHKVQPSDEGLYSCSTDKSGSSPQSFLRVRGEDDPPLPHTTITSTLSASAETPPLDVSPPPSPPVFPLHLFRHLLVICPYCICSILLLLICCSRNSGNHPTVSMETTQSAKKNDDVAVDITTEHDF